MVSILIDEVTTRKFVGVLAYRCLQVRPPHNLKMNEREKRKRKLCKSLSFPFFHASKHFGVFRESWDYANGIELWYGNRKVIHFNTLSDLSALFAAAQHGNLSRRVIPFWICVEKIVRSPWSSKKNYSRLECKFFHASLSIFISFRRESTATKKHPPIFPHHSVCCAVAHTLCKKAHWIQQFVLISLNVIFVWLKSRNKKLNQRISKRKGNIWKENKRGKIMKFLYQNWTSSIKICCITTFSVKSRSAADSISWFSIKSAPHTLLFLVGFCDHM